MPAVDVVATPIVDRAGVIRQVAPMVGGHPTIALTFDDGPDPQWTPQVLAILRATGVKATFCMVGVRAAAHPDLVRAIAADGHTLCYHTVHHDEHLDRRPLSVVNAEIAGAAATIAAIAGRPPTLYRPPGGTLTGPIIDAAHRLHLPVLDWDDDPKDWKGPTAPVIEGTVMNELKPGAIVLLHDGGGDRSATVAQLADLIGRLERAGYAFAVPG
jgi:peptidoglycan/xylan/chitin deacetylase (PgdA/CDA1 family)